ncbi:hypothetical protein B4Q13_18355, partial [Lacticaseibacillus rhamnosus]
MPGLAGPDDGAALGHASAGLQDAHQVLLEAWPRGGVGDRPARAPVHDAPGGLADAGQAGDHEALAVHVEDDHRDRDDQRRRHQQRGVAFIMNDRPDLAAELDCDGVHVGEEDMPYAEARRLLGPDSIVGVTCGDSRHRAVVAAEAGADYVAFGAFGMGGLIEFVPYPVTTGFTAGIAVFATGGIGGVHRGASAHFDVSPDLAAIAQAPVAVVCAGAKSVLDVPAT